MANIIIYDPNDVIVGNKVIEYIPSASTPDYENNPNTLINPDMVEVSGTSQIYWKAEDISGTSGTIVEMTQIEKDTVDKLILDLTLLNGETMHKVEIKEEDPSKKTGGNFDCLSVEMEITATSGSWQKKDISFSIPIALLSAETTLESLNKTDVVQFLIGPETKVGVLISSSTSGDTILTVNSTVTDNIQVGFNCSVSLSGGSEYEDLGIVTKIDKPNSQITVDKPTTLSHTAIVTDVKQTVNMVSHLWLPGSNRIVIGESKIGASYIPANTILRMRYQNNEGTTTQKTFSFRIEYLY